MRRLLAVSVLLMILVPTFLLPATVRSQSECPTLTHTKIAITNITETSSFASITVCITSRGTSKSRVDLAGSPDNGNPVFFEYGTAPGVYTNKVQASGMSSNRNSQMTADDDTIETICWVYTANFHDLDPCTNYHVRFWFSYNPGGDCQIYQFSDAVSYMTQGCLTRTLGQGGAGTASGISTVPAWAKPVEMSNITVQSAAVATPKVSPGQSVDVTASVTNKGTVNGATKLTLYVNGEEVESKGVTVSSGQTAPVHFYVSRNEPGTYSVFVNGVSAGNFEVDPFTNNDSLIYAIIALFVLGIVGMLYFIVRRRTA